MSSKVEHNKILRIICFGLLIILGITQFPFSFKEQQKYSDRSSSFANTEVLNARGLTFKARDMHIFEADMDGAMVLLQQALSSNPYYIPAWLALSELYNDLGKKQRAEDVLQYAIDLTKELKRWRWSTALTAYQLGRTELLPTELNYIIQEIPGKNRNDALQLAFTLWAEPKELLDSLGLENIQHFFVYSVNKKMPEQALFFWKCIESAGVDWQERNVLAFIDMLLSTGHVQEAGLVWNSLFNSTDIVHNGDFSQKFLNRAFGWREGKNKGFVQRLEPDPRSDNGKIVNYRFKGWENLNFYHLTQIVPVESGQLYELTAEYKSQKLTSDQRPFFEVYGYKCKMPYAKSEMAITSQDWDRFSVIFGVSEECYAVVVRLRRKESTHIDNRLAGKIWLKNVAITKTGEEFFTIDGI